MEVMEVSVSDPISKEVQIHIHEHVGPLRERVGKIEGRMEVHERELTMLRQGLDGLRDRIDLAKDAMLNALEAHTVDEIHRYESITKTGEDVRVKVEGLRNWIIAVGIGAASVFGVFEFMARVGMIRS
jgi:hypothetical protein